MAYREIYVLMLLFFFVHASLLTFGFVQGVAAYDNLNVQLSTLNSQINPTEVLDVESANNIDPNTAGVKQLAVYWGIVTTVLSILVNLLQILLYLLTGVFQTLQALYLPADIVFILAVIISLIQYVGVIQLLVEIMAAIPRVF